MRKEQKMVSESASTKVVGSSVPYPTSGSFAKSLNSETQSAQANSYKLVLELLVWISLAAIAWGWTLSSPMKGIASAVVFTCVLSVLVGVRAFIGHGEGTVTVTGLYGLSTSMFVGYSGLILVNQGNLQFLLKELSLASVLGLTAQIATIALAWGKPNRFNHEPFRTSKLGADWLTRVGLCALILSILVDIALPQLGFWAESAAFTAISVIAAGLIFRDNVRLISWQIVAILALVLVYSEFFHSGSGRLRIVALACAVAVILTARFPLRRLKVAIVAAIPLAIGWLASMRLELQESLSTGSSDGRTGLESMTAPLEVFSLLVKSIMEQRFVPENGYNLLSVIATLIPESMWPDKPMALGYELVQFVSPERYGDGLFSTAATSTGEGVFNFGWLGIPIVIIFAASVLRLLDSAMIKRLRDSTPKVLGVLGIVLIAILAGAVADYTWSGVHTYVARMIARLPVFVLIVVWARLSVKAVPPISTSNTR